MDIQGMKQQVRSGEVLSGSVNVIPSAVSIQARERTHELLACGYTLPVQGFDVLMLAQAVMKEWASSAAASLHTAATHSAAF